MNKLLSLMVAAAFTFVYIADVAAIPPRKKETTTETKTDDKDAAIAKDATIAKDAKDAKDAKKVEEKGAKK